MNKNTGIEFEKLTESIYRLLVKNQDYEKVEHNVFIEGADGRRQVDVLITSEVVGVKILTAVECRDLNVKISVGAIDGFHSKLIDINANKGILVSRKGFSNKAVSKAQRLGISLCTAHEALSRNWRPDIDMPILIEEIQPTDLDINFSSRFNKGDVIKKTEMFVINGLSIPEIISEKWKENSLKYDSTKSKQQVILEEIKAPFYFKFNKTKTEVSDLKILLTFKTRLFLTSLTKLKGTKILKNITEGNFKIFLEIPSLENLERELIKIKSKPLKFTGIVLTARIIPELNLSITKASLVYIKPNW